MERKKGVSRRDFIKLCVATAVGVLFKPENVQADNEYPYMAQPTWNTCGYAVMAMFAAQYKNEDVKSVYGRVKEYFEMIGKYDVTLGESALKDYLERKEDVPVKSAEATWDLNLLQYQIENFKSTIVCVTSNYGVEDSRKNPANHWVLFDNISEVDGKAYALVRDPLRSAEVYKTKKKLTQDMIPAKNGSIYIPIEKFIFATGINYLHRNDGVGESQYKKIFSSGKIR
jgi:hypothetical protein